MLTVNTDFAQSLSKEPLLPISSFLSTSQMTVETFLASEWRNAGVT